jgi:hypothetical protein
MAIVAQQVLSSLYSFLDEIIFIFRIIIFWHYFLYLIAGLLILILIWLLRKEYTKWNCGWLSYLIEAQISESINKKPELKTNKTNHFILNKKGVVRILESIKLFILEELEKIFSYLKNDVVYELKHPYLPSITWLIFFLIIFGLFFVFSHNGVPYGSILHLSSWRDFATRAVDTNGLSNVISILSGFVSIVFALIIFIAESVRDSKNPEQKRVLLKVSGLWFLITFTTLSLLNFLWFKVAILSLIFPILIAIGIIMSFWRVINVLIDPEIREENRVKLLKDRIKRNILDSVRERIGNNILLGKIGQDKEIKIEYTFSKKWLDKGASGYLFIESSEEGWLSDINLTELAKLVKKLEDSARQLGFSLYLKTTPSLEGDKEGGLVKQSKVQPENIKKVYLLKRYGEQLPPSSIFTEDSKVILALPKEFNKDQALIDYVRNLVPHIFRFSKTEPSSNVFRRELQSTKDQLVSAIKSVSLGSIEELKQTYLHLAETFLETMHQFGGGFSVEQAKKERGNIFEGWNEIRWLTQDIRELIIVASETENRDIISDIAFLPIAIAIRAVQAKDHFLFQEFVGYSPFLYYLTKDKPEGNLKSFMIERSWRYLKELSDFYIEPQLTDRENENSEADFKTYEDFTIYLFRIFQTLLKSAFDQDDLDTFKTVLAEFSRLYRHFDPENDHPNVEYLEATLNWAKTEDEKINVRNKIAIQQAKEKSSKRIKLAREQVCFGLASKIFDKYRQKSDSAILKGFFEAISPYITNDLVHLTEVFDSSRNFNAEDQWGWDDWEIIADGDVHSIDVHGKLDQLYCVVALRILKGKTEQQIEAIKLTPSRNLAFLSEERPGANNLTVLLNSIDTNPDQWSFVLNETERAKVPALKSILKKALQDQEKNEEDYLKTIKIDPEKLKEFREKIKEAFYQFGYLRPVLKDFGVYKNLTTETPGKKIPSWGYNQIDEKAAFIKDWYVHYGGWGENYGQGMANSEDQLIFEKMVDGSGNKNTTSKQDIISEIEKVLNESNLSDPIILQTLDRLYEYDQVRRSEAFISRYSQDCPKTRLDNTHGYMGVLKLAGRQVPVIDLFVRKKELKNKVVITDLRIFGTLNQYSPIDDSADSGYKDDIFFIKVTDLNEDNDRRQKIITEKPAWLEDRTDKDGYLRQKALINLYQKFEFKILDPKVAYCITVSDLPAQDETD